MILRCSRFRCSVNNGSVYQRIARRRYASSSSPSPVADRTRNIGIIAHIDAGKTTTTERMLYYAGFTRQIGDVDQGSTVTDFLPAERARGITIQSASITFSWPPQSQDAVKPGAPRSSTSHTINLIDTPGHADFTFEVLRSLRVLDGAVCILDSVAGVEAQTEKVWSQASAYQIPKIIFVNKLDRDGASFARTVQEIGTKLNVWPAVCGIPWWNQDGSLRGIGDVINLRALSYPAGSDGKDITVFDVTRLREEAPYFLAELKQARTALVELVAEHDDELIEKFLEANEDHMAVSPQDVRDSLRRCNLSSPQRLAPVFAGASFRNVGVQPLLDGVVDLLPTSLERPDPEISFGSSPPADTLSAFLTSSHKAASKTTSSKALAKGKAVLDLQAVEACALAFKVVSDPRRGVLVYVRVYSGSLRRNALLWNTNLQNTERAQRLLRMYANDAVDIDEIQAGQIGVVPAMKYARTGDSLIVYRNTNPKYGPPEPVSQLQLKPIDVPPPVFFVSVEPDSLAGERHVKESLELLLREDPSLNVSIDEESGQTHLAGMGELHLEIARDRLVEDLKAKARIGNIEISYREAISASSDMITEVYDREVSGRMSKASCTAAVEPRTDSQAARDDCTAIELPDNNILFLRIIEPQAEDEGESASRDRSNAVSTVTIRQALHNGALSALARGPTYGYPLHSAQVTLSFDIGRDLSPSSSPSAISSAARLATTKAMRSSASIQQPTMMEPVMRVAISVDEANMGNVVQDVSSARGGSVISLDAAQEDDSIQAIADAVDVKRIYTPPDPFGSFGLDTGNGQAGRAMRTIVARVPLKEMVGYLKHLRSLTGGRGTFTMAVDRFEKMSGQRVKAVLGALRGEI